MKETVFGLVYRTALVLDKSNNFFISFAFIFVRAPNAASFLFVTVPPYHQRFTRNHDSMNRLSWVHSRRASAGTVVLEHSSGKHVSSKEWNICTRKYICRFCCITSRPFCQINKRIKHFGFHSGTNFTWVQIIVDLHIQCRDYHKTV